MRVSRETGMRLFISIMILSLSISALVSCSRDSVESTFQNMRKEACSANYEGFFQYIDKQAVRDNFKKQTIGNFTEGASEGKLSERSQGMPGNYEEEIVAEHMKTLWANYENWLNMGESGPLCKMKAIKVDGNSITVNIPGHPDSIWGFDKSTGGWKLVSMF